jgi:hypothetical protein
MTAAKIGDMITASTKSRSSEPVPPPKAVSLRIPISSSTTCAINPASNDAVVVTRMVRTSAAPSRWRLGGRRAFRSRQ